MDDQLLTLLLLVGALGTGIALIAVRGKGLGRRLPSPPQWAHQHGWEFRPTDPSLLRQLRLLPVGDSGTPRTEDVLLGSWNGVPAVSFRYEWETLGRGPVVHREHVTALALPAALPWLTLAPAGRDSPADWFVVAQTVELESARFNERWTVHGPHGRAPHDFLHPRMMARLLEPDAAETTILVDGANLVAMRHGFLAVDQIEPMLALLADLAALVPDFVWQDARGRRRG